jgi:Ca2+/Na+ antiporter
MSSTLYPEVEMTSHANPNGRTRWRRTKFARGRFTAMGVAIPAGLVLAAAFGSITLLTGVASGDRAALFAVIMAAATASGFVALIWALVVDRTTLRGALDKPEESIESTWLDAAQAGALRDTVLLTGLTLMVLAVTRVQLDTVWTLVGVILLAGFSVVVRYLVAKRRG